MTDNSITKYKINRDIKLSKINSIGRYNSNLQKSYNNYKVYKSKIKKENNFENIFCIKSQVG